MHFFVPHLNEFSYLTKTGNIMCVDFLVPVCTSNYAYTYQVLYTKNAIIKDEHRVFFLTWISLFRNRESKRSEPSK
jgi:hypothetical protein